MFLLPTCVPPLPTTTVHFMQAHPDVYSWVVKGCPLETKECLSTMTGIIVCSYHHQFVDLNMTDLDLDVQSALYTYKRIYIYNMIDWLIHINNLKLSTCLVKFCKVWSGPLDRLRILPLRRTSGPDCIYTNMAEFQGRGGCPCTDPFGFFRLPSYAWPCEFLTLVFFTDRCSFRFYVYWIAVIASV